MKFLAVLVVSSLMTLSVAMAADAEKSATDSVDTSKNPITGTVTKTKKVKRKVKGANGKKSEVEVTDTTKKKTNGEVKEDVKVDTDAQPAK